MLALRGACICCRRRKVRCDRLYPCSKCKDFELECVYETSHKQKLSRARRASVIKKLKTQPISAILSPENKDDNPNGESQNWGGFPKSLLRRLIEDFFKSMHFITPILDEPTILSYFDKPPSTMRYSLVLSMCSVALLCDYTTTIGSHDKQKLASKLLDQCLTAYRNATVMDNMTVDGIRVLFFVFSSYFRLSRFKEAWFYLREAITVAQVLQLDVEEHYETITDSLEANNERILFFILFITERGFALQQPQFPLTLKNTPIKFPDVDTQQHLQYGLSQIVKLFTIAENFKSTIRNTRSDSSSEAQVMASLLLERLDFLHTMSMNMVCEIQRADFVISHLWLRLLILEHILPQSNVLSLRSHLGLSGDIDMISRDLSRSSLQVHGLGMVMKLCDILKLLGKFHGLNVTTDIPQYSINGVGTVLERICAFRELNPYAFNVPVAEFNPARLLMQNLEDGNSSKRIVRLDDETEEQANEVPLSVGDPLLSFDTFY